MCASFLSGADMSTTPLPQNLEANRIEIEQCGIETKQANLIEVAQRGTSQLEVKQANRIEVPQQPGTESMAFAYLIGDELHERVAANKPVKDLIFAVQPQAERSEFTTLAVYQDNQDKQGKESSMLATQLPSERTAASTLAHKDGGIQNDQWTAFSPERTEQTGRTERSLAS